MKSIYSKGLYKISGEELIQFNPSKYYNMGLSNTMICSKCNHPMSSHIAYYD